MDSGHPLNTPMMKTLDNNLFSYLDEVGGLGYLAVADVCAVDEE